MLRVQRNFKKIIQAYQFSNNNVPKDVSILTSAMEVSMPVFPLSRMVLNLSHKKFQELNRLKVTNITALVRKDGKYDNLIDQYYSMGTYCDAKFIRKANIYEMILNGVQRVQIQSITELVINEQLQSDQLNKSEKDYELVLDDKNDKLQEFGQQINELDSINNNNNNSNNNNLSDDENEDEINNNTNTQISQQGVMYEDPNINSLLQTTIQFIQDPQFQMDIQLESLLKHLIDTYSKILYMNRAQVPLVNYNFADAYRIIDSLAGFLCTTKYFDLKIMQETLETLQLVHRLDRVHNLMTKYLTFLQYYSDVGQLAQQNLKNRKAQEFYNEMFKIVKGQVEGKKGKEAIIETMNKRMALTKPPDHIKQIFLDECNRYLQMDDMSSESNMLRTYLDWISQLPYGLFCEENMDLNKAKQILDQDHFGMDEIKERILEFIAVSSLSKTTKGRILLLVGPPGVGKTSLASSIAKALDRPFARISMGGESDVSFFKGHRRTYVGAYPGKIIFSLKVAQKENCVILLDEIDKLGRSELHGDPQSTLLEILDPEQNKNFTDNYLDFPIDLSRVLFICSANSTHTIQAPLLDRMDIIELSSYTNYEKREIYNRHLLNRSLAQTGLKDNHKYNIEANVLDKLIKDYCREPGVRSLEKYTKKIIERIAFQIIEGQEEQKEQEIINIGVKDLPKIIGQPRFTDFKLQNIPPGVAIGLAYTEYGGSLLYLEVTLAQFLPRGKQSKNISSGLKVTGSLGDVMQESIQISYTYAKLFAHIYLKNSFFEQNELHIHAPEGAIPKDGPSAGITITSGFLSLALGISIPGDLGMTGEISLNGLVLPIGGCKEKILAAQREGLKRLVFPEKNKAQIQKLKQEIKEGIEILYVKDYKDVFQILFPNIQINYQQNRIYDSDSL